MLRLLKNNGNLNINFNINQIHDFTPKNEAIKKYIDYEVAKTTSESLLEEKDVEHVSFIPKFNFTLNIKFANNGTTYQSAGITNYTFVNECFYLFDIYDTFVENTQTFISRNYVKLGKVFSSFTSNAFINFDNKKLSKEFRSVYIPEYLLESGDTFYLKISFFNAANGKLRFFKCGQEQDSQKNYFKIILDKPNKTYYIYNNLASYTITELIEGELEKRQINQNAKNLLLPPIPNEQKTITSTGKFV
jgi:hypothetical protein